MPLDQHIEGRQGERKSGVERRPHTVHDPLAMADHGQHGEHRLHQHGVLPLAALTEFEVGVIALGGMARGNGAYILRLLDDIAAQRDSPEAEPADTHYHQALALADELGMRPRQAHCHRGLGMLYAQPGRQEQARPELSAAIALYRAMDMTFWLPQTEAALAQMEGW